MTIERKVGMGIAGQPSGSVDVAEVFSTFLYTAGSAERKVNGIDLAGEGGMVWTKSRTSTGNHRIQDTVRGTGASGHYKNLTPNSTSAEGTQGGISTFHDNGYSIDNSSSVTDWNTGSNTYASWTFRKKEKFFDIVTYTGNGSGSRGIAHGLDGPIGMIFVKRTNGTGSWGAWHRSAQDSDPQHTHGFLNTLDAFGAYGSFDNAVNQSSLMTDSIFTVGGGNTNSNGHTYVAYLFADNSSEDAEEQMIKCGIYTGNGSTTGPIVNLGWEPQFLITKRIDADGDWNIFDTMRGLSTQADRYVLANTNQVESNYEFVEPTSTGFQLKASSAEVNTGSGQYIFMAIRAPMMKEPSAASEVFAIDNRGGVPAYDSGFPVDFFIQYEGSTGARLTGRARMRTHKTEAEITAYWNLKQWNSNVGIGVNPAVTTWLYSWMWKRAKGFFDVVAYTGNATARVIPHSLGVVPEMIWVKKRSAAKSWSVYHKDLTSTGQFLSLDNTYADTSNSNFWNNGVDHTSTTFSIHTTGYVNSANATYISCHFATLAGISKVGSYTGNGSSQTINCGFSAGAKYVLIKRTDATGDWHVWDSARGIVAGDESYFRLNIDGGEQHNEDAIDPHNSGFIVNQITPTNINVNSATYIFYAIA